MKSSLDIARELGVTARDIERKLSPEFARQFGEHIEEIGGETYFDGEVEEFLRLLFARGEAARAGDGWEELRPANAPAGEAVPARAEALMLPAPRPSWRATEFPLLFQPEVLEQAVERQRREIAAHLNQFDKMVDRLVEAFPAKAPARRGRAVRRG